MTIAAPAPAQTPLAPREVQVLERLSHGLTSRQISRQLGITPSTVETYVSRLREKLNAPTRAQLVRAAVALGM